MASPDQTELRTKAAKVSHILLQNYGSPIWANTDPLDELILTVLSQNTNDNNRDKAYRSMRLKYHTWEEVRDAPLASLVDSIRIAGLGNQKAARIQSILKEITQEKGCLDLKFLKTLSQTEVKDWLLKFKGVGLKTAAIVMQFSLGMPAFPVDTHVYRVSGRLGLRPVKSNFEQAHEQLGNLFTPKDYGHVHLNLIRLGREICHARNPACNKCPLTAFCEFYIKSIS